MTWLAALSLTFIVLTALGAAVSSLLKLRHVAPLINPVDPEGQAWAARRNDLAGCGCSDCRKRRAGAKT